MKLKINKIVKNIYKDGYYVVKNVLTDKKCNKMVKSLENLKKKVFKNKHYKDECSKLGQIVIRDLVLREPEVFLSLIDKKLIINVLNKIFEPCIHNFFQSFFFIHNYETMICL